LLLFFYYFFVNDELLSFLLNGAVHSICAEGSIAEGLGFLFR
jgi:hypothetical protein